MTYQPLEQEETRRVYETILIKSKDLVRKMLIATESRHFDDFVEEFSHLRADYLLNFEDLTSEETKRGHYFLNTLDSYIRNRLDVMRVREMRESLLESVRGNRNG
jgi:hypothetical protein